MKRFITVGLIFTMLGSMTAFAGDCGRTVKVRGCRVFRSNCCTRFINTNCNKKETTNKTEPTTEAATNKTEWTTEIIINKQPTTEITTNKAEVTTVTATSNIEATTEATTESISGNKAEKSYAEQVLDLVNKQRAAAGLSALTLDENVSKVAQLKSEDMRDKNYFNHTSPTYGSPFNMLKQYGISYSYAGENIAKGQKTPEAVVNAWMNSEGHRANILNKNFTKMGLGYATGNGSTYWTQMFIK